MELLTMLEATGDDNNDGDGLYVWEIHGLTNSTEHANYDSPTLRPDDPPPGTFPTAMEAYRDLVGWLHEAKLPANPSTAQIQLHHPFRAGCEITHVVRIG